jgi:hypothetical protein
VALFARRSDRDSAALLRSELIIIGAELLRL